MIAEEEVQAVLEPFRNKPLSNNDLRAVESAIGELYAENGYITTFAYLRLSDNAELNLEGATVAVTIAEGRLEKINVKSSRLSTYIKRRLKADVKGVVQEQQLQKSLRFLLNDPRIDTISVTFSEGSEYGASTLNVDARLNNPINVSVGLSNNRSPSVSSFERQVQFQHLNVLGLGDALFLGYRNTNGSDAIGVGYSLPINRLDGTVDVFYQFVTSSIIEEPFEQLDIEGRSDFVQLTYRQPILRRTTDNKIEEVALGASLSHENSSLTSPVIPFPISEGSEDDGRTRITAIRFFQEWSKRQNTSSFGLRSQFSLGVDVASTDNQSSPDGQFFKWEAGARWSRKLPHNLTFNARANLQFSDRALLASEQFAFGGPTTVRGFRQNSVLSDNGFLASLELDIPVYSGKVGRFTLYPFFDVGTGFDNSESVIPTPGTLASVGIGLSYQLNDRLKATAEWGIPLINRPENRGTLQEEGIHLSIIWNPL
ncbi:Heme/hemopexin transporter protein HuxB [Acaryochloris thomasi RCC1774]|uniref:Heme/hemopexin transporter protein HuxB n=1 Tax=Acaryochloris thomasi RCC1774 TaxID=1764569 RepID=A0A2W1JFW3_9CYAN|nr:Heme/hemopexin transporter protein HuxB [Acaryochloris thomasi RCC1774]